MLLKDKSKIFVFVVIIILFFIGFFAFILNSNKNSFQKKNRQKFTSKSTILSNIKVSITKAKMKNSIVLSISNIPTGTKSIEYELTYPTEDKGLQGVIGTIDEINNSNYQKELFLGTCSSGTCVEHKVSGAITLTLRFKGNYGEEVFEREFQI